MTTLTTKVKRRHTLYIGGVEVSEDGVKNIEWCLTPRTTEWAAENDADKLKSELEGGVVIEAWVIRDDSAWFSDKTGWTKIFKNIKFFDSGHDAKSILKDMPYKENCWVAKVDKEKMRANIALR